MIPQQTTLFSKRYTNARTDQPEFLGPFRLNPGIQKNVLNKSERAKVVCKACNYYYTQSNLSGTLPSFWT